jgi:SAM-dependent methyltransferase
MSQIDIPADRAINHGGDAFHQGGAKFAETFEIWGGLKARDNVLDIGCGPGRMAIGIGERFNWSNNLIGFDVIKVDVDVCQHAITRAHPNFQFHHINAWNGHYNPSGDIMPHDVIFPAQNGTIDFAFAASVFTHMFRREVSHYLSEIYRVLAPGGRVLTTWFVMTDEARAATTAGRSRFRFDHAQPDGSFIENPKSLEDCVGFMYQDALDLFHEAGFKDIKFHQGAWSRTAPKTPAVRHSQDVFVCRK